MNTRAIVAYSHTEHGKYAVWLTFADDRGHGEFVLAHRFDSCAEAIDVIQRLGLELDRRLPIPVVMFARGWPES